MRDNLYISQDTFKVVGVTRPEDLFHIYLE